MRKFAFSYPLLLLAMWTGLVLAGDYVLVSISARQFTTARFESTVCEIMQCDLGQGAIGRRGIDITYSYIVNGMDYVGRRYRYDDRDGAFDYKAVARNYSPGSKQTVYYEPDDPAESVLSPGLSGCDLLLLLFAVPLNIATLAIWGGVIQSKRNANRLGPAGGVKIIRHSDETRARLADLSPAVAGIFGMGASAFVIDIGLVLATGFAPGVPWMKIAWGLTALGAVAAFVVTAHRNYSGRYDLWLLGNGEALILPQTAGRAQRVALLRRKIAAVSIQRRVTRSPSGEYFSFIPTLEAAAEDDNEQSFALVNWGWREAKALAFSRWLQQQLDVPFKGIEDEKKAAATETAAALT